MDANGCLEALPYNTQSPHGSDVTKVMKTTGVKELDTLLFMHTLKKIFTKCASISLKILVLFWKEAKSLFILGLAVAQYLCNEFTSGTINVGKYVKLYVQGRRLSTYSMSKMVE